MKPLRSTYPQTSILSPQFRYVPASQTNISATFVRWRLSTKPPLPQTPLRLRRV